MRISKNNSNLFANPSVNEVNPRGLHCNQFFTLSATRYTEDLRRRTKRCFIMLCSLRFRAEGSHPVMSCCWTGGTVMGNG